MSAETAGMPARRKRVRYWLPLFDVGIVDSEDDFMVVPVEVKWME